MNSKLRDEIIQNFQANCLDGDEIQRGQMIATQEIETWVDVCLLEAIRQAVGEEMLGLVEHPRQVLIQIDDFEHLNGGYISHAELRQKIKQWQGGE